MPKDASQQYKKGDIPDGYFPPVAKSLLPKDKTIVPATRGERGEHTANVGTGAGAGAGAGAGGCGPCQ